jgi:Zn-dependent M28 family amino/carboxypeptidase
VGWLPGIGWSDQWAFWKVGYPAIMVTDTAPYRYPFYHTAADTLEKIDYDSTARVVSGLTQVVMDLLNSAI